MLTWLLLCILSPYPEPPADRPGLVASAPTQRRTAPADIHVTARTRFFIRDAEVNEAEFFRSAGKILNIDLEADRSSIRRINAAAK